MNCARVRCRRWGRATPCLELPLLQDAPRCARGTGLADRTASPKQIPRYQARGFAKEWRQKGFSLSFFPLLGQFSPSFVWSCAGFLSSGPCPSRATECSRRSCRDTHTLPAPHPVPGTHQYSWETPRDPGRPRASTPPHVQTSFSPAGRPRSWAAGFKHVGMPAPAALPPPAQNLMPSEHRAHLAHISIIHDFPSSCLSI